MNDWFSWNGKKCTEYDIHVLEQPPITIPAERATFTNVPGRPGSLTTLEGDDVYDDLILTAQCMISDPSRISDIAAYLKGSSTVTFANRPGGFYFARIVNQIPFEKILRGNPHRSFAVNFRCKPFWYQENVQLITLTTSGTFTTNPGSVCGTGWYHGQHYAGHPAHGSLQRRNQHERQHERGFSIAGSRRKCG